jgi:hypothetical protein
MKHMLATTMRLFLLLLLLLPLAACWQDDDDDFSSGDLWQVVLNARAGIIPQASRDNVATFVSQLNATFPQYIYTKLICGSYHINENSSKEVVAFIFTDITRAMQIIITDACPPALKESILQIHQSQFPGVEVDESKEEVDESKEEAH